MESSEPARQAEDLGDEVEAEQAGAGYDEARDAQLDDVEDEAGQDETPPSGAQPGHGH